MSFLIFCSFEVGGLPYKMAEILNKHGVETYYVSLDQNASGHDSTQFHFGNIYESWDLSHLFDNSMFSISFVQIHSIRKIIRILKQIKVKYGISHCFATGSLSYLLKQAGINYKYWCYGSDLDQQCFAPIWQQNYPFWKKCVIYPYFVFKIRNKQRNSIYYADSVMIAPYQIDAYNQICPDKKLFHLPHFLKILDYKILLQKKTENRKIICKGIKAKNFFFSSARHVWAGNLSDASDNKGNDIILKSFEKYLKLSNDCDTKLILIKKGPDVEASKSLAQSLSIDKYIIWVNEMNRGELDKYYQAAIMCFGQLRTPVITFSVVEPLANGTICVSFFEDNNSKVPFYKEKPPIFNSKDPDEIANFICKLMSNKDYYTELCYKSWCWIKDNCSEEKFVESFLELFSRS